MVRAVTCGFAPAVPSAWSPPLHPREGSNPHLDLLSSLPFLFSALQYPTCQELSVQWFIFRVTEGGPVLCVTVWLVPGEVPGADGGLGEVCTMEGWAQGSKCLRSGRFLSLYDLIIAVHARLVKDPFGESEDE
jgi:hypothetical protein